MAKRKQGKKVTSAVEPDMIIPRIKTNRFAQGGAKAGSLVESFCADLSIIYAVDAQGMFLYPSTETLDGLFPDRATLRATAVSSLAKRFGKWSLAESNISPTVFLFEIDKLDGYPDADSLLLDAVWTAIASVLRDKFLVAAPSEDLLLLANDRSKKTARVLQEAASSVKSEELPGVALTERLLKWKEGVWQEYVP